MPQGGAYRSYGFSHRKARESPRTYGPCASLHACTARARLRPQACRARSPSAEARGGQHARPQRRLAPCRSDVFVLAFGHYICLPPLHGGVSLTRAILTRLNRLISASFGVAFGWRSPAMPPSVALKQSQTEPLQVGEFQRHGSVAARRVVTRT